MKRLCAAAVLLLTAGVGILTADSSDPQAEARKLFLHAHVAVSDGRFQEALDLYRRVIEKLPDDAIVRFEYAQLLRDLNVPDEALRQAKEAVRLDPQMPEGHRLLGSLELSAAERDPSQLDAAIAELKAADEIAPGDPSTAATLARALLAQGKPAQAVRVLESVPQSRRQPALMRLAAEAKSKSGDYKEAESLYRELYEANPGDREIAAALIELYEDEDRIDDALKVLRALRQADPDNGAIDERIALDLARAGRFAEAEKLARDLAARRPENRAIRRLLAQVLFEKGDVPEGERILRALRDSDPDDEATARALASELVRERRFDEADAILAGLVQRAGDDPKRKEMKEGAQTELGFVAFARRDYAGARKILEPLALANGDIEARALRILLGACREMEDWPSGLEKSKAAAALEPRNSEWAADVAEFSIRTGDKKKGDDILSELAASEDPDRVLASADAWARLKDYPAAARVSKAGVGRFPQSAELLFRLGSSLERAGDFSGAEDAFRKLLELRPDDAATQNYLGYMWADKGVRLDEAYAMLQKAVAREPRNGAYLDSLGWACFRLGRMDAAERNLLEAHRREPDDPTIEEHLGDLQARQGNVERAIAHWERALTLKPEEPEKIRQKLAQSRARLSGR
ncbi:MAG TPA: tetratricopeptide repeat protein [Thermoanaerobaculia bacterium]|nr:tetratricopeptide repeat protein [Thermoanaerobaculia bacterium]